MLFGDLSELMTDVVIIGSGGAGLMAAIEARKYAVDVTLIDKVVLATNNNTRYSGGGLKAALPGILSNAYTRIFDTPSDHVREALIHGEFINDQELIETLCYDAPSRILDLQHLGVPHFGEIYLKIPYPHGTALVRPLLAKVKAAGCKTLAGIVCVDLLVSETGSVIGMVGIDVYKKKLLRILAKATVLATGGAGELFKRNDTAANTTGDGLAIAHRAGARLRDMEFVQFEPYVQAEPGLPMMDRHECEAEFYGVLKNKNGEAFLQKYVEEKRSTASVAFHEQYGYHLTDIRELVSRAMATEVQSGRGDNGAVLFDLRHVGPDKWEADIASQYTRTVLLRGFDIDKRMLHVFPGAICTLGGIRINADCETDLAGLHAAGECTGGVHGAARLGGDALAETLVYGARAGRSAARHARQAGHETPANQGQILEFLEGRFKSADPERSRARIREIKNRVQNLMWENVSMIRARTGLERASTGLRSIEEDLEGIHVDTLRKLREYLEARNMVKTASFITGSALLREESRGAHYRSDFPFRDDRNWLKSIFVEKGADGQASYQSCRVDVSKYPPLNFSKFGTEVKN